VKALQQRVAELETTSAKLQQTQSALLIAERWYKSLFECSGESIFIVDPPTLRFLDANSNAARRLGYSREELLQLTLEDVESTEAGGSYKEMMWESSVSGTTFYQCHYRCQDGREIPVEVSSRHVRFSEGGVLLHFVRDVSWRKKVEADREQLILDLQEALKKVQTLKGLLPICANCKKIRDDQGYWQHVEKYVAEHSDARFSHGLCPRCVADLYPEFAPKDP